MAPNNFDTLPSDYQRIAQAIEYLQRQHAGQPNLAQLSQHLGLSEHHVQRLFSRWAGVSPKRFVQYLTKEHAKAVLRQSNVLDTALRVGLSGTSRLHDLMITCEAVSPGEYASGGQGVQICHGTHASPFGQCLIAITSRGICKLGFFDQIDEYNALLAELLQDWPHAQIMRDDLATRPVAETLFVSGLGTAHQPLHLLLKGSNFQMQVWQALLRIPSGQVVAYGDIAQAIDRPAAARAVGTAIASNRLGYLIPCHRVIRQSGHFNHYRWGGTRKQAMLAWEAAHSESALAGLQ
jgi:AraC family transcriptional regulator of adaptative response/methylated-DNA-[protein]-cysteine methyltransferase